MDRTKNKNLAPALVTCPGCLADMKHDGRVVSRHILDCIGITDQKAKCM